MFLVGYFTGVHQQTNLMRAGEALLRKGSSAGPAAPSSALPQMVRDYLVTDCDPLTVAGDLQQAETLRLEGRRQGGVDPWLSMLRTVEATNERMRVLTCVWWWGQ